MNFVFFQDIYDTIITPTLQAMEGQLAGIAGQLQQPSVLFATLWLVLAGYDMANHSKTSSALMKEGFIVGCLFSLVQLATYNTYVAGLFLQGIPDFFTTVLGARGAPTAVLDRTLAAAVTATFEVYDKLPSLSIKSAIFALFILGFLIADAIALAFCFATYMIAAIMNVAVVLVGPVFLAAGILPFARRYVGSWANVLVGGCVTQLMTISVIALLSAAEINMFKLVMAEAAKADSNSLIMIWGMLKALLALALFYAVIKRIPSMAHAIGGGVYHGVTGAYSATFGAAATVTNAVVTQAATAATAGRALMSPGSAGAAAHAARRTAAAPASLSSGG